MRCTIVNPAGVKLVMKMMVMIEAELLRTSISQGIDICRLLTTHTTTTTILYSVQWESLVGLLTPITQQDYDGLWHTLRLSIKLVIG